MLKDGISNNAISLSTVQVQSNSRPGPCFCTQYIYVNDQNNPVLGHPENMPCAKYSTELSVQHWLSTQVFCVFITLRDIVSIIMCQALPDPAHYLSWKTMWWSQFIILGVFQYSYAKILSTICSKGAIGSQSNVKIYINTDENTKDALLTHLRKVTEKNNQSFGQS